MNQLISSFMRALGRGLGYSAARQLRWLAVPLAIGLALLGFLYVLNGGEVHGLMMPPTILGPKLLGL